MKYYKLTSPDMGENIYMQRASHREFYNTAGEYLNPDDIELPFIVTMEAGEKSGYDQYDIDFEGEVELVPVSERLKDFYSNASIMSVSLAETLLNTGVNNLQLFPVIIKDHATGEPVKKEYRFFNIVGLISCAKLDISDNSPIGSTYYFHEFTIDETKTDGALMFRLAESPFEIIVAENVAIAINNGKFKGITAEPLS